MIVGYILDGHVPVEEPNLAKWARWIGVAKNRRVARTDIMFAVTVSTAFLGLDCGSDGDAPLLFETMILGGPLNKELRRYCTWEDAERGHLEMVKAAGIAQEETIG